MVQLVDQQRRAFLRTTGGLIIAFYAPLGMRHAAAAQTDQPAAQPDYPPNAFVRIATDDSVTILINKSEMGQGVYTSLAMLIAEELDADWSQVRVVAAPVAPVYRHTVWGVQATGGSTSVASSWQQHRLVGAAARALLVEAAAHWWKVKASELTTNQGFVLHPRNAVKLSYGQLAEAAGQLPTPQPARLRLKDAKDFKLIGKSIPRLDTPEKVTGKAQFGLDVQLPDMLVAVVARAPAFGAMLRSFNADRAKAVSGVVDVVQIPSGLAVVASGFWAAQQGRDALIAEWSTEHSAALSSTALRAEYGVLAKKAGALALQRGMPPDQVPPRKGDQTLLAEYELPYLAHATMEPMNCTVDLRADHCDIYTGTQFQGLDQARAAAIAGLSPAQVRVHTSYLGGGFGRRANPQSDFVAEAVQTAKLVKKPIKVIWTREDDMRAGWYRPAFLHRLEITIGHTGLPHSWLHRVVGQSIVAGTAFENSLMKNGIDAASVEGLVDTAYSLPNFRVELHSPKKPVPVLWWRSVGHSHTAFAMESCIDELAHLAGRDPLEYRMALLSKQFARHRSVLKVAAERAGWGKAVVPGRGLGLAVHHSFGSYVAQVADVSVEDRQVRVHRVVCVVDCGQTVNPDTIAAQMESSIVFGLSAALYGAITLKDGGAEQGNFDTYPVLRGDAMPTIEVHILPSQAPPSGVGEPAVPPIAPAVANALFAATGRRIRRLPLALIEFGTV